MSVEHGLAEFVHLGVAFGLAVDLACGGHFLFGDRAHLLGDLGRREEQLAALFGLADLAGEFVDEAEHIVDVLLTEADRLDHARLIDFGGADFDHVQAVLVP